MPKAVQRFCVFLCGWALTGCSASAQSGQWTTYGHDPQRSGWANDEAAFSPENVSTLGLVWKTIVPNEPLAMNGLTAPLVVRAIRTQSGERNLVIVAGSSGHVFALDAENGKLVWQSDVAGEEKPPGVSTWLCPFALNATPVIDIPNSRLFVVSSDGRLHSLALADGHVLAPPTTFVPPFSKMWSLNYSNGVLYTSLSQDCNNAHSGIVALEPDRPGRPVTTFYSGGACGQSSCGAGVWGRGGPSVDFAGFVYGATGDAGFDPDANVYGDSVLKLSARTLQLDGYYTPPIWEYLMRRDLDMGTSTPVLFHFRGRVLAAVGGKEGAIYIADATAMEGANHHAAAYVSGRYTNQRQTFEANGIWGEMSVWIDSASDTWLYVPSWGEPTGAAKFPLSYGPVQQGSIMAFRLESEAQGNLSLTPEWVSGDIAVPDPVAIAGGVVFALGTGENPVQVRNGDIDQGLPDREKRNSRRAILHALDAHTGKELWSSETTIIGWTHFSGLGVGDGKVLVTTHEGAVYAFALRRSGSPPPGLTVVPSTSPRAPAPVTVQSPPTVSTDASAPQCGEGGEIFQKRCSTCHGAAGEGNKAAHTPNFADPTWRLGKSDSQLLNTITNGKSGGMPAFGDDLTPEQISRLLRCVVRGFSKSTGNR